MSNKIYLDKNIIGEKLDGILNFIKYADTYQFIEEGIYYDFEGKLTEWMKNNSEEFQYTHLSAYKSHIGPEDLLWYLKGHVDEEIAAIFKSVFDNVTYEEKENMYYACREIICDLIFPKEIPSEPFFMF
jgi:hypothetical protein